MNFDILIQSIERTHNHFQHQAAKAVNVSLTIRNWLIGFYIVEFEQNGTERAAYGEMLIQKLADCLQVKGLGETNLKIMRIFYLTYPFLDTAICKLIPKNEFLTIRQTVSDESSTLPTKYVDEVIGKISYSHFIELIKIEDGNKRRFFVTIQSPI